MPMFRVFPMPAFCDAEFQPPIPSSIFSTGLAKVCHDFGAPLIVDEAHGSHLAFHSAFPEVLFLAKLHRLELSSEHSHKMQFL